MDSPNPLTQAIRHTLKQYAPDAFLLVAPLIEALFASEEAGDTFIKLAATEIKQLKKAWPIVGEGTSNTPMILWQDKLFWARLFIFEKSIANRLSLLAQYPAELINFQAATDKLNHLFGNNNQNQQKQAAALSLLKHFMLISGGPGTGKTTTIAKLIILFYTLLPQTPQIALAAPTGKAAARLTQSLHQSIAHLHLNQQEQDYLNLLQGQTLHRLLGLNPITQQTSFSPQNPLPIDILILDEASMLDLPLMQQTLFALKSGARLILLGDKDQLPSIGAGALLQELFTSSALGQHTFEQLDRLLPAHNLPLVLAPEPLNECVIELTKSHRFEQHSGIGNLAKAVNTQQQNLTQIFKNHPQELQHTENLNTLSHDYFKAQEPYWQAVFHHQREHIFATYNHLIMLTVLKEDAQKFNQTYLKYLEQKNIKSKNQHYFAGQSLMITQNDYLQGLFNGDIGIVLPNLANKLTVFFENSTGLKKIALSRLPPHEVAFAYTVHKSQGSEFNQVWLLPPSLPTHLFNQALLYTAITRAREKFKFWGNIERLQYATNKKATRKSALRSMLNTL